jgi:hypothetical protein
VQLGPLRGSLKNQAAIRLTVLGDNISTGADASGVAKVPPHQPGYPDLVAKAIRERSGSEVTLTNLSVGGMDANWGVNDASSRCPAEEFAGRIRRTTNPRKPPCRIAASFWSVP